MVGILYLPLKPTAVSHAILDLLCLRGGSMGNDSPHSFGRSIVLGDGRLLVAEVSPDLISIAGLRRSDGVLPGILLERRDLDALIAALMRLSGASIQPIVHLHVEHSAERLQRLLADERQFPFLAPSGTWRKTKTPQRCDYCQNVIAAEEQHFFEVPSRQCFHRRCAIAVFLSPRE